MDVHLKVYILEKTRPETPIWLFQVVRHGVFVRATYTIWGVHTRDTRKNPGERRWHGWCGGRYYSGTEDSRRGMMLSRVRSDVGEVSGDQGSGSGVWS